MNPDDVDEAADGSRGSIGPSLGGEGPRTRGYGVAMETATRPTSVWATVKDFLLGHPEPAVGTIPPVPVEPPTPVEPSPGDPVPAPTPQPPGPQEPTSPPGPLEPTTPPGPPDPTDPPVPAPA
ncbi:hypothetical protein GCM10009814_30250 [Lapillicoccus jejuensis]